MKKRAERQIAVYGKGGIGKSTIISNLAVLFGQSGKKVLLVGCDPKHDTSYKVCDTYPVPTVLGEFQNKRAHELKIEDFLVQGRCNITCIEAGGPEPGIGCAGRGISKMFELFETMRLFDRNFDVILYDVLGDVVCGGFAVPVRSGYATEVLLVTSGEVMSLYAANNICRAHARLNSNGVRLAGVIGNLRGLEKEEPVMKAFTDRIGSQILHFIPRDNIVIEAEGKRKTVVEYAPDSSHAAYYKELYRKILDIDKVDGVIPRAMGDIGFEEFVRQSLISI